MRRREFLAMCAAAGVCSRMAHAEGEMAWSKSLFIMDTWFWLEAKFSAETEIALLKENGFGGMALSWGQKHAERLAALKAGGLATPGCFIAVDIDGGYPEHLKQCVALMKDTGGRVWLALTSKAQKKSDAAGDDAALAIINSCADACKAAGVPGIALYPHVGFWQEKVGDAQRLCEKAKRPDVGLQFNQFHWMAADGGLELKKTLQAALPHLQGVSINGSMKKASILPLSEGDYDVLPILRTLYDLNYTGPISHQGYSIKGNLAARLAAVKETWAKLKMKARA